MSDKEEAAFVAQMGNDRKERIRVALQSRARHILLFEPGPHDRIGGYTPEEIEASLVKLRVEVDEAWLAVRKDLETVFGVKPKP